MSDRFPETFQAGVPQGICSFLSLDLLMFPAPLGDLGSARGHHESPGSQLEGEEFPPVGDEPMGSVDAPLGQEVKAGNLLQRVETWAGIGPTETHGIVSQPHGAPSSPMDSSRVMDVNGLQQRHGQGPQREENWGDMEIWGMGDHG
ncbi:hypothetical protein DUI87_30405 [Hirundo rustica rustica]|uniref:Uncharacterized protein n=1 Tax=Hirundo rustica rustica TaxID=333673 RepID=A0A3M0JEM6_HIRRU|nr:hypothetical protein DUI87_30405 [Hirundo rustica rustica]